MRLAERETAPNGSRYLSAQRKDIAVGRDGRIDVVSVTGPDGSPLTLADLPSPTTRRWVSSRKAKVVAAVEGGLLSFHEACERYNLTWEEFRYWEEALHQTGLPGLKGHNAQQLRNRSLQGST